MDRHDGFINVPNFVGSVTQDVQIPNGLCLKKKMLPQIHLMNRVGI